MMDTTTCTTIVLALLWLSLCCQILGSLVAPMREHTTTLVLSTTTTLSTILLAVCLWQCKKAGYLVTPMTWYHWVLLGLLVLLQVVAVVLEERGWGIWRATSANSTYPIYGIVVVLLGILGGTLYCGWKCNLFCRPCCKSQYICYGSAIVVVVLILIVLAVTALLAKRGGVMGFSLGLDFNFATEGVTEKTIINYLGNILVPITHCYTMAMIWNTILRLPYTVPEVVALVASALTTASMLALAVLGGTILGGVKLSSKGYPFLAVHLVALGITWYCLEYKQIFYWSKNYMCFGLLAAVVILVALVAMVTAYSSALNDEPMKYTLLGYSFLLMVPTLWYAYRCGLLTWRWNSCLPKKKGLKATDNAENTTADSDIAKES